MCPGLWAGPALRSCRCYLLEEGGLPPPGLSSRRRGDKGGSEVAPTFCQVPVPGPLWVQQPPARAHSEPRLMTPSLLLLLESDSELDQGLRLIGTSCQWWMGLTQSLTCCRKSPQSRKG